MGRYNATRAALSGHQVALYDVDAATLAGAPDKCADIASMLAASGFCKADQIPESLRRITVQPELTLAVAGADLVSESVFERIETKHEIHRQLDVACAPETIVTTNSSFILLSEIESVIEHRERFAALHFYMASPLVDIVAGSRTDASVTQALHRYVKSLNCVPLVLKKEYPGYLLNAMLGPVLATAKYLRIAGATCEDVDRAWMRCRRAPMGPFGIMDLIGLGLIHDSWLHREDEGPIPGLRSGVLDLLGPYVERDELGMQSGRGFYAYPDAPYLQPGFVDAGADRDNLYKPMELALLGSALAIAGSEVAEPAVIDRAWKVGMVLDTGPFEILADMGVADFMMQLGGHVAAGRFDEAKARLAVEYLRRAGASRR